MVERHPYKVDVGGSIPSLRTNLICDIYPVLKILNAHKDNFYGHLRGPHYQHEKTKIMLQGRARMFFDLNNQPYEFVDDGHNLVLGWNQDDKPKIALDIWHNFEHQTDRYDKWLEDDRVHIITNVHSPVKRARVHFVDFLFNRTKAYYSDFKFHPDSTLWYWQGRDFYINRDINRGEHKTRIFVAPNQPYFLPQEPIGRHYRRKLVELLKQYVNLGWVSDPLLFSNHDPGIDSEIPPVKPHQGYNPIHQDYYQRSFVSIYGETIEQGQDIAVTEKTYEPLIKGHFILPFSNQGFISYLKSMGIQLPKFIDYSYDEYSDPETRWQKYQEEILRLLSIPITMWQTHWAENIDLLKHNQDWFNRPYDRVDIFKIIAGS